jgi:hypothetical protein
MELPAFILFWGIVGLDFLIVIKASAQIRKLKDWFKLRTAGITVEANLKANAEPHLSGKPGIRYTAAVKFDNSGDHLAHSTISISQEQYERLKDCSSVRVTYLPSASKRWPLVRLAEDLANTRAHYQSILIVGLEFACIAGSILALLALWPTAMTSNTCSLYGGCNWK